jgi:hypothetical protein
VPQHDLATHILVFIQIAETIDNLPGEPRRVAIVEHQRHIRPLVRMQIEIAQVGALSASACTHKWTNADDRFGRNADLRS